jgi:V/A-type H+-transporting ATPase subunit I
MILTFFAHKKFGKKMRDGSIFGLLYVLSGCAIAWGVLSGTFFGQAWLPEWVKPLIPALREDRSVQMLCFFLGALHMSLGHAWRAILKWPSLAALCDAGWAMILWGAYFVAGYLVLSVPMPAAAKWLLAAGSLLVVLFTDASKGILRGIPGGFGNLLLNIMNNLTDVVSYVRLFAVGLASLAVADSFNKIALDIGFGSFGTSIVTGAILMFGQLLNVVLGPLSVLVHGIRLNVLEFCNHVDIKWTGFSYDPLREDAGR